MLLFASGSLRIPVFLSFSSGVPARHIPPLPASTRQMCSRQIRQDNLPYISQGCHIHIYLSAALYSPFRSCCYLLQRCMLYSHTYYPDMSLLSPGLFYLSRILSLRLLHPALTLYYRKSRILPPSIHRMSFLSRTHLPDLTRYSLSLSLKAYLLFRLMS